MTTKAKTTSTSSARARQRSTHAGAARKAKTRKLVEPTRASLKEVPEIDFERAKIRRNPYAARIATEGLVVQVGRGRRAGVARLSVNVDASLVKWARRTATQRRTTLAALVTEALELGKQREARRRNFDRAFARVPAREIERQTAEMRRPLGGSGMIQCLPTNLSANIGEALAKTFVATPARRAKKRGSRRAP